MFNILKYFEKRNLLKQFKELNVADIYFNPPESIEDLILCNKMLKSHFIQKILKTQDGVRDLATVDYLFNLQQLYDTTSTLIFFSGHNYTSTSFYDDRIFDDLDWYGCIDEKTGKTYCIFNRNITEIEFNKLIGVVEKLFAGNNSIHIPKIIRWLYISSLSLRNIKSSHYNMAIANLKHLSTMKLGSNLKTYGRLNIFTADF